MIIKTRKGKRGICDKTDLELLQEWSTWKKSQPDLKEEDLGLLQVIDNVCSQVGNYKARLQAMEEKYGKTR